MDPTSNAFEDMTAGEREQVFRQQRHQRKVKEMASLAGVGPSYPPGQDHEARMEGHRSLEIISHASTITTHRLAYRRAGDNTQTLWVRILPTPGVISSGVYVDLLALHTALIQAGWERTEEDTREDGLVWYWALWRNPHTVDNA